MFTLFVSHPKRKDRFTLPVLTSRLLFSYSSGDIREGHHFYSSFFCVQGRIPETLKATSSPAPIDRQWQGTVADNVDGGNGGGDRSSTNGDVWVPRAVCGAVPPSSAFANQVQPP